MPIIDTRQLRIVERLPGWRGRFFHGTSMTVAHYEFDRGAAIHEHFHPEEELYEVTEGELEIVIAGSRHTVRPGIAALVPAGVPHAVRALSDGRVIIVDHPARPELG